MSQINVIDLFAGPGGLGEGFSAYTSDRPDESLGERVFKIRLSIEMDGYAHQTLMLRSFVRQFEGDIPPQYYDFYRGKISLDDLKEIPALQDAWRAAEEEVGGGPLCMGDDKSDKVIEKKLATLLSDAKDDEKWVVIGGPPCQAFSSVGRVRNMAKPDYRQSEDERIYAYIEYLKILDQVQPDCFVLENVEGMLQTAPDGGPIFPTILRQLEHPSEALKEMGNGSPRGHRARKPQKYTILAATDEGTGSTVGSEYLVPIVDYGVPQDRRRVILIGVRKDIVNELDSSEIPRLQRYVDANGAAIGVSVGEVIGDLPKIRSKFSTRNFYGTKTKEGDARRLSPIDCFVNGFLSGEAEKLGTVKAIPDSVLAMPLKLPRATSFPANSKAAATIRQQFEKYRDSLSDLRKSKRLPKDSEELWQRLLQKNASLVSKLGNRRFSIRSLLEEARGVVVSDGSFANTKDKFKGPEHLERWLLDSSLGGVRNHESREHKGSDLLRYLYFAVNTRLDTGESVNLGLKYIPAVLQPDHANAGSGHFSDRFRVQVHDKPAKTITCHLGKDGHAFIHYDPVQCRALSVREAARLQTFPDNYVFLRSCFRATEAGR